MFNPKYDLSVCNPTFYVFIWPKLSMRHFMAARPYSKGLIEKMTLDRKCMVTGQVLWPLLLKAIFLLKLWMEHFHWIITTHKRSKQAYQFHKWPSQIKSSFPIVFFFATALNVDIGHFAGKNSLLSLWKRQNIIYFFPRWPDQAKL